ncbi:OmpA family protein [Myxococcota bacterium]|nr:OmpA family protein [Myxococcota bacterium]MBU1382266.1 OmpA family protein [Myxococcota bacterium]MBU1498150.1 OmpA family protein [Myxococcota bacterium]
MKKLSILSILLFLASCAGVELEGRSSVIKKLIETARENGAKKCAPKELAQAETHYEFSQDEMSQGKYHEAVKLLDISGNAAREAIRKSPPERCAKKVVVDTTPKKDPIKLEVKILDTDGDGIYDDKDKCPNDPEDKDGFEDEDGCPDPDNDGDGICDPWVKEKGQDKKYEKVCKLSDKCPGTDKDKANNFKDTKEDKDGFEDDDGCPDIDNDGDGLADKVDKCPGVDKDKANNFKDTKEDMDGFEDDDGCPDPDNDKDGIPDVKDKCPNEPETKNGYKDDDGCPDELKLIKVTVKKIELKQKVFFDDDKAVIKKKSFPLLNEIAQVLKARNTMTLRIEGHTDNTGPKWYNLKLSRKRARAVRQYLIKKGIDPSRLKDVGYGMDVPIDKNETSKGRDRNRRVEFVITHQ